MRRFAAATGLVALAACAVPADAPPGPGPEPQAVRADEPQDDFVRGGPHLDPPTAGFNPDQVREIVERIVALRLGEEPLRLARSSPTSILVTHHQGMPRPVQLPDGSWSYEAPGANAMVRSTGWQGWSGRSRVAVSAAKAAEIDRLLADPAFRAEPDYVPPTCTDAGARRMVIRHAGRVAVREQSCGGEGLTNRLWALVYGGPG